MTTTTSMDERGKVAFVDERYVLGEVLGAGAMGKVFAARDRVLGIDVAVKMMHPTLARSKKHLAHFSAEAALCARMLSPNVVKVMGLAVTRDGAPCIVYERLEGETLGERIARDGGLSLADTAEVVKQVARALARAHMIGVIHRDVKPDNIFLCTDTRGRLLVKLLDFGIAAMVDVEGTYAHAQLAGTPEYMAPELLLGTHELDARADLYALGVVAFECLTGRCPFMGDLPSVVAQLRAGATPAFTEHRPDLLGAVDAWMARALHAEPFWRFVSAKELAEALEAATRKSSAATTTQADRVTRVSLREAA